jgi:hypothetical protein
LREGLRNMEGRCDDCGEISEVIYWPEYGRALCRYCWERYEEETEAQNDCTTEEDDMDAPSG